MTATLLKSQEILKVSSNGTTVTGDAGSGIEVVIIDQGVTGTILDINVERVVLNASSSDFTYQNESNSLVIYSGSSTVATIPIQADANGTQVTFSNGTVNVFAGQSGMTFGAVPVNSGSGSSTATSITPITIDPYFTNNTGIPPVQPPPADNPVTGNLTTNGNSTVGSIISVTSNTLDDPDGIGSIMYTWYSSPQSTGGTATTLQATATADPYTIQNSDNGNYIWLGIHIVDVNSNVTDLYTSPRVGPVTGGSGGGGSDVTAPVLQSATAERIGTDMVVLTYNEPIVATGLLTSAFTVTSGGSSVTINSVIVNTITSTVTLSITLGGITAGQAVTVNYTQPNDGTAIQDSAGNKAASLTNYAVTNNITVPGSLTYGQPMGGGYYAGNIVDNGITYKLIVSPKASGSNGGAIIGWGPSPSIVTAAQTLTDGVAASNAMNASSYPAAYYCKGLNIGGFTDWYLPARDELEVLYRNLKPGTDPTLVINRAATGFGGDGLASGTNANSSPVGTAYTVSSPVQTGIAEFKTGGTEAFVADAHWSSTESDDDNVWAQYFSMGDQARFTKINSAYVRAIRRVV